jgi:hypothetical protein
MSISNDPLCVPFDRVIEMVRELGVDPVNPSDIRRITIDPMGIEVVRYRRTATGSMVFGFAHEPLTETVTIGFEL